MIGFPKQSLTSVCSWLVGFALVVGLSGSALAQGVVDPPPTGPVNDLQTTLGIILDRLDDIEDALLPESLGPCDVPPVWGKKIAGADRFVEVLDGGAYCDQETGLVWEQSPNGTLYNWSTAISWCADREVDDRKGWALPMREQLASLVDASNSDPALPTGHPFLNVQSPYWSATTVVSNPANAWHVGFGLGGVGGTDKGSATFRAWCVRGGQVYDGQNVPEAP